MVGFLTSVAGDSSFGADAAIGQRAMARFSERWEAVAIEIGAHISDSSRVPVQEWADAHPIRGLPYTRTSIAGTLAKRLRDQELTLQTSVGGIEQSIDRLHDRLSFLDEYAVKQGMWITQYATLQARRSPELTEMSRALGQTGSLAQRTPELLAHERAILLAELNRERIEFMAAIDRERVIVQQDVADERKIVLREMSEQRRIAMQQVDTVRTRAAVDLLHMADRLVFRLAELVAAALAVVGVAWLALRRKAA
jgi:hypothetical protein